MRLIIAPMPNDDEDLWVRPATLNEARRMLLDPMRYSLVPAGHRAAGLTGERRGKVALTDETVTMLHEPGHSGRIGRGAERPG